VVMTPSMICPGGEFRPNQSFEVAQTSGKLASSFVKRMDAEGYLFQIVLSLSFGSRITRFLDCREQKADKDGDDSNDHQQFDKCEATATVCRSLPLACASREAINIVSRSFIWRQRMHDFPPF